jgi:predicted dehydrogenase
MNKILLIGCGYWGKNWYKTIMSSPYELVGVVDPNPVVDVTVPLFNSIEEVNVEYTHAIIATNAELHLNLKNQLNIPDSNILVEKPCGIESNRSEFNNCFPGYIFLSSPQYKYIKDILNQGILGNIIYSRFERASMGPRIRTDVSIIEDYAIHDLYLYQALFEPTKTDIIGGRLLNSFDNPTQPDTLFLDVSSNNHITTFFSSWRYPSKTRKIEIVGENGSIVWENDNVYFHQSHYKKINGLDKNRNVGYELIETQPQEISLDLSQSNLHLQLDDFLNQSNRKNIFLNTNNFIWKIQKELLYLTNL